MMTEQVPLATAVVIAYRKNRLNTRLIFGKPRHEIRRGWHRKLAVFYPGDMFAYERWRGDQYGTQAWSLVVCKAMSTSALTQIQGVIPCAKLLLNVGGKTKVKRTLSLFDALKAANPNLETLPETCWRDLHHRLATGEKTAQIIADMTDVLPC